MPFLRPLPMVKVGVVGLKDDRELLVAVLHDMGVLQVEPIGKAALQHLTAERSPELQRIVSDQLIRFRGLRAALPITTVPEVRSFATLEEILQATKQVTIDEEVGQLKREEDQLLTDRALLQETLMLLSRFGFYSSRFEYLNSKSLLAYFGEAKPADFDRVRAAMPALTRATHFSVSRSDKEVLFLLAIPVSDAEAVGRLAQEHGVKLHPAPPLSGTAAEERPQLERRRAAIDERLSQIRGRLAEIASAWYPMVVHLDESLDIENRKLEAYTRMGASDSTFALEGWIRKRDRTELARALQAVVGDRTEIYDIHTDEEPPTIIENPRGIRWYEMFIRFYSIPQASEWDPTWTFAIVFPILFGFMVADVGYAAVILAISLWMIVGFPGGRHLPGLMKGAPKMVMSPSAMRQLAYCLVPGCLVAIALGVATNAYFGFSLGYTPLFSPLHNTGQLLVFAGYIGIAMVVFGFALGALKEYFHHRKRHAIGKIGGIVTSIALAGFGLGLLRGQLTHANLPIWGSEVAGVIAGLVLFAVGEGLMGMFLGFIEVLSHILSFTRLVGILLASVILALVINNISTGLLHSAPAGAGIAFIVIGIVLIIGGQMFNVVLGVFEPSIQGMRLMFVEHFSKFYEGSGKPFKAFGSRRTNTQSHYVPAKAP